MVLVPVAARNAYVGGGFYITTSQFGPNFYIGNNPSADGTYQSLRFGRGAPEYERQDATELAERALGRTLTPAEVSGYWTDKALEFVTSRPGAWLALTGRKIALLWNATEMIDTESQEAHAEWSLPLRVLGFVGHFGILVPLALFGAIVVVADAIAAVDPLCHDARLRRQRRRLLCLRALSLSAGADADRRSRRPARGRSVMRDRVHGRSERRRYVTVASLQAGTRSLRCSVAVAAVAVFCNWPLLSKTLMRAVTETNLGVTLQADGRLDEAIDHYHRAIALAPDYPPAYNNLATALRAKGQLADAVATYQQALRLRPEYPEAEYNLANALIDEGKPQEAAEHFRIALQTIPASADVHNNLGIALMAEGKRDEAIARVPRRAGARSRRRSRRTAISATRSAWRTGTTRRCSTIAAPSQIDPGRRLDSLRLRQPAGRNGSPRGSDRRVPRRAAGRSRRSVDAPTTTSASRSARRGAWTRRSSSSGRRWRSSRTSRTRRRTSPSRCSRGVDDASAAPLSTIIAAR